MKKIICVLLVLTLLLSFSACFNADINLGSETEMSASTTAYFPVTETAAPVTLPPATEEPLVTAEPVVPQPPQTRAYEPAEPTEYHDDYDLPAYTTMPEETAETTTEAPVKQLNEMTDAEVIEYFNKTLNAVKAQNVGFKKSKLTSILDLQLSNPAANALVSFVKGALLSETADETTVNKGESGVNVMSPSGESYASALSAEDAAFVNVSKSGDNYVIRVGLKELINPDKSSAYGKIFDFMTVDDVLNIYAPKVGAKVAKENIEVVFSDCYAELTVDANDRAVAYTTYVKGIMNMNEATIRKVVTINTDVAVTLASTTEYTNFVY